MSPRTNFPSVFVFAMSTSRIKKNLFLGAAGDGVCDDIHIVTHARSAQNRWENNPLYCQKCSRILPHLQSRKSRLKTSSTAFPPGHHTMRHSCAPRVIYSGNMKGGWRRGLRYRQFETVKACRYEASRYR